VRLSSFPDETPKKDVHVPQSETIGSYSKTGGMAGKHTHVV
jgi:hypothetical protein